MLTSPLYPALGTKETPFMLLAFTAVLEEETLNQTLSPVMAVPALRAVRP